MKKDKERINLMQNKIDFSNTVFVFHMVSFVIKTTEWSPKELLKKINLKPTLIICSIS